jgi:hypothetical protein
MLGKNLLWVAKQHGHSVQMMFSTYAARFEGTDQSDIEAIEAAMQSRAFAAQERFPPPRIPRTPGIRNMGVGR